MFYFYILLTGFKKNCDGVSRNDIYLYSAFILLFVIQLVGVSYSENKGDALIYVQKNIVFLLLPIAFINYSKIINFQSLKNSVYGLLLGVIVILLSIYINILSIIFENNMPIKALLFQFVRVDFVKYGIVEIHPPYFGVLVVFCIVILLYNNFFKNKLLDFIIRSFLFLFFIFSLYGISSFMSILLLGFLLLFHLFYLVKNRKIKILMFLFLVGSMFVISKIDFRGVTKQFPGGSLLGRIEWSIYKGKGDTSRPENWNSVLSVVKEHPFFGIGSDGGLNELQKHRTEISESFKNKHNAHNQYLEILLRHGILGLILYLFILAELFRVSIRTNNKIFVWFLLTFTLASITESYLVRQIGLTFFTFFALLFYTLYYPINYKENSL
ncbi:hypothetical protein BKP44_15980 [Formosa algae]|nr:hypothetical protein BKP44_15980 [Formosa algae]